ncbi:alginate lyase family protein [Phocaeicola plebeius]|uniref:Glycoside hydrolase family 92 protein n=1 Tax=Phocaeicola plebeius CAG:211 TaxID=1263052 RepID=R5W132_9BACT|nr:alginate lyase family protein [Phocaeicola plebeius]CCZ86467.1 glycoside hydrolase family 92 protein [Phocaeicola plebeius CAG:211]
MKKYIFIIGLVFFCAIFSSCLKNEFGIVDLTMDDEEEVDVNYIPSLVHPGILHTMSDIERMREIVANQEEPGFSGYKKLESDPLSSYDYSIQGPFEELYRGNIGGVSIQGKYESDFNAAYQNAVMYAVTQDERYAKKSTEILIKYGETVKTILGDDTTLLPSIMGVKFIYAVELMRYLYPQGMTDESFNIVCNMLKTVFIPVLETFMSTPAYSNGNWGASVGMTYIAASVLFNDKEMYKKALEFYLNADDNGTIRNYIDGETGQCQESGRDQAHTQLGLACLSVTCEIAYKQGTDLYSVLDNRLMKGFEYTAKYNLGYDDVPYSVFQDVTGKYSNWDKISAQDRGEFRPIYEMVYNHYVNRKGLDMPYTQKVVEKNRPEGFYYEHFGFGTFLFNDKK